jgi:hypothetical protein
MSATARRRNLAEVATLAVAIHRAHPAFDRIADGDLLGQLIRAATTDGEGTGGKGGHSDPTGSVALAESKLNTDERELNRHILAAMKSLVAAHQIVTYWTTDLPAKAEELVKLEREANPGCEVVAAVKRPGNAPPYWEEEHLRSDVGGLLPRPYRLGQWAYRFVRGHGRLPTEAETRAHCEGKRVYVSA